MITWFDLETTGAEVESARIVQIAAVKLTDDLSEVVESKNVLVNPGIPIPPEATAIHGITDDMVKDCPRFPNYAKGILEFFSDCMLGGYNILRFDIPVLAEEFARCKITKSWPAKGTAFIDSYIIFAEKEKRDLSGAVKFYTGVEMENAHDAFHDIMATVQVFKGQMTMYPDLREKGFEGVHDFCQGEHPRVDLAGKIVLKEGVAVYNFGKDKGKSVKENPGFAHWMLKSSFPTDTKNALTRILYGNG